jgi:hypothetical protein
MTDEPLKGADYRARVRLSTKADETLAEIGATCEHVPVESLAPLLASRKIALATASSDRAVQAAHDALAAPTTDEATS